MCLFLCPSNALTLSLQAVKESSKRSGGAQRARSFGNTLWR